MVVDSIADYRRATPHAHDRDRVEAHSTLPHTDSFAEEFACVLNLSGILRANHGDIMRHSPNFRPFISSVVTSDRQMISQIDSNRACARVYAKSAGCIT
jgi:hypothetical protein